MLSRRGSEKDQPGRVSRRGDRHCKCEAGLVEQGHGIGRCGLQRGWSLLAAAQNLQAWRPLKPDSSPKAGRLETGRAYEPQQLDESS